MLTQAINIQWHIYIMHQTFLAFFLNASHLALKFLTHLFHDLWGRLIIFD